MTNDESKRVAKKPANERKSAANAVVAAAAQKSAHPHAMSETELARLGGGQIAYIKIMTSAEAKALFPAVQGLPQGINLYSVHGADGTPLALTDSMSAAISHAMNDELVIATVH
jgi:hypothetical protein